MKEKKIIFNGHEAVDLGLNVKWAICNIGANKPEDIGEKYHWGEIELPSEESRFYDEERKCIDYTIIGLHYRQGYKRWRYKTNGIKSSVIQYDISGSDMYDVARHKWGSNWRMPTPAELDELIDGCTWEPMKIGNQCGWKITGKNGNSIILPADEEFDGYYYSSRYQIDTSDYDYCDGLCILVSHTESRYVTKTMTRIGPALPIRPVTGNEDKILMFQNKK